MAAISSAIIGGAGLAMSAYQTIDGANQAKKAQRQLNDYERQELDNAFKDIEISTLGADLLREENARTSANMVDAAQQGGSRSIIGAVPKIVGATNQINQQAARMIDDQNINREFAIAGDNARIEGIIENRDMQNIGALGSQVNAGRQDMMNGIMGGMSSLAYMGRGLNTDSKTGLNPDGTPIPRPQIEGTGSLVPMGVTQFGDSAASATSILQSRPPTQIPNSFTYNPMEEMLQRMYGGNKNSFFSNPII
jgi:hypothetical protein